MECERNVHGNDPETAMKIDRGIVKSRNCDFAEFLRTREGLDDFLRKIRQSFLLIEPHEVLASIEKCRSDVWAKALRREDL